MPLRDRWAETAAPPLSSVRCVPLSPVRGGAGGRPGCRQPPEGFTGEPTPLTHRPVPPCAALPAGVRTCPRPPVPQRARPAGAGVKVWEGGPCAGVAAAVALMLWVGLYSCSVFLFFPSVRLAEPVAGRGGLAPSVLTKPCQKSRLPPHKV